LTPFSPSDQLKAPLSSPFPASFSFFSFLIILFVLLLSLPYVVVSLGRCWKPPVRCCPFPPLGLSPSPPLRLRRRVFLPTSSQALNRLVHLLDLFFFTSREFLLRPVPPYFASDRQFFTVLLASFSRAFIRPPNSVDRLVVFLFHCWDSPSLSFCASIC